MKNIIAVLAIVAVVPHWALLAQSPGESALEETSVSVQPANRNGQPRTAGQSANNNNLQPLTVQQNRSLSGGTGGGGIGRFGGDYGYRLHNVISRFPGTGEKPLIVRSSEMNPKDEANLEEDLTVMAHLLDKAVEDIPSGQAHTRSAMGIDVFVASTPGAMRSIYLQGYGALFQLNVGLPVLAPASPVEEEKPSGDSAWEEARQELYGRSGTPQTAMVAGEEFSEEKVNRLKEALLRTLKNATNIRGLEGNITVCVLGGANFSGTARLWRLDGANSGTATDVLTTGEAAPARGTVLTIKVTKADVDAFAKGELKFSEFQERARIAAYTAVGSDTGVMGGFGSVETFKR